MRKSLNVAAIDDHPLILESYKQALTIVAEKHDLDLIFNSLTTIGEAQRFINDPAFKNVDMVLLDIRLPDEDEKIKSGEDLGILIREKATACKIVVATTFSNNYRVNGLLKNLDPEGMLVKADLTPQKLVNALIQVWEKPPFYSETVLQLLRKLVTNDQHIDQIDRQLLYELSLGAKMSELPNAIPMSLAGLEKRKRNLKLMFGVDGQS
ncbi:MAG: DNA-binding response regulator, partial [Leeuwenhoekiella sp.]